MKTCPSEMAGGKLYFVILCLFSFRAIHVKKHILFDQPHLDRGKCVSLMHYSGDWKFTFVSFHVTATILNAEPSKPNMNKTVPMCDGQTAQTHHSTSKGIFKRKPIQRWDACVLPVACVCRSRALHSNKYNK